MLAGVLITGIASTSASWIMDLSERKRNSATRSSLEAAMARATVELSLAALVGVALAIGAGRSLYALLEWLLSQA
jgi:hypothetical protein